MAASSKNKAVSHQNGFSMAETLVATLIFSLITAAVLGVISSTHRSYATERTNNDAAWQGRASADLMVGELRMAGYPARNTYLTSAGLTADNSNLVATTFRAAEANRVAFEADLDGDGIVEYVEYRLNGSTLERTAGAKNADGSAPAPQFRPVVENIVNGATPLFTYTTDPYSTLAAPANTNSVQVRLIIRTQKPDPKTRQYRVFQFAGAAYRQNPER